MHIALRYTRSYTYAQELRPQLQGIYSSTQSKCIWDSDSCAKCRVAG